MLLGSSNLWFVKFSGAYRVLNQVHQTLACDLFSKCMRRGIALSRMLCSMYLHSKVQLHILNSCPKWFLAKWIKCDSDHRVHKVTILFKNKKKVFFAHWTSCPTSVHHSIRSKENHLFQATTGQLHIAHIRIITRLFYIIRYIEHRHNSGLATLFKQMSKSTNF